MNNESDSRYISPTTYRMILNKLIELMPGKNIHLYLIHRKYFKANFNRQINQHDRFILSEHSYSNIQLPTGSETSFDFNFLYSRSSPSEIVSGMNIYQTYLKRVYNWMNLVAFNNSFASNNQVGLRLSNSPMLLNQKVGENVIKG